MSRFILQPVALVLVAALIGCGSGSKSKPAYGGNYSYSYAVDPDTAFRDEAPANKQLTPGELPLAFVDQNGNPVDLTKYRGKSNVVLVVVRGLPQQPGGVFCPHCLAQTRGLMANEAEFQKRDAVVLVVFPGPADRVGEFIEQAKSQSTTPLPGGLPVLLDKDLAVVQKLGIQGDLARPSTYILDKQGAVVYGYVGETTVDRPSTKALLAQLDKLQGAK
jgi:peroxiredoxin